MSGWELDRGELSAVLRDDHGAVCDSASIAEGELSVGIGENMQWCHMDTGIPIDIVRALLAAYDEAQK